MTNKRWWLVWRIILLALSACQAAQTESGNCEPEIVERVVTYQVIITATPDPNVTPPVIIITATPEESEGCAIDLPGDMFQLPGLPTSAAFSNPVIPPTVVGGQPILLRITGAGDLTIESITIQHLGDTVDLSDWTLSDSDGNVFVFPAGFRLFANAEATVNTRTGQNTPIMLFWGREEAVFRSGEVVILTDADNNVRATLIIP